MLQTQIFQSFARRRTQGVFRLGALATVVGGAYGFYWHQNKAQTLQQTYDRVDSEITEFQPKSIDSYNALVYPWAQNDNLKDWEYQLVKLFGYFRDERVFVKREREGKDGYLVLAPFITAQTDLSSSGTFNQIRTNQIMVNLGWVPAENKFDIEMSNEPIGTFNDEDVLNDTEADFYTGFTKKTSSIPEDLRQPFTELTGLVRRGEKESYIRGFRNWPKDRVFNFIDLWWMSRFFRANNLHQSSLAYIERVVPEIDEESAYSYPIPGTKGAWVKDPITPYTHQNLSYMYALSSVISLGLYALRR